MIGARRRRGGWGGSGLGVRVWHLPAWGLRDVQRPLIPHPPSTSRPQAAAAMAMVRMDSAQKREC